MNKATIRKVLLIDDDKDDFSIFKEALNGVEEAIQLQYIGSGNDIPDQEHCTVPDLLFLDINMPDKNGFEWLRWIREKGYAVPIVMYSTASNPDDVQWAFTEGANMYLPKPDNFRSLQQALQQIIALDWASPEKVTERFLRNGRYEVFDPGTCA